MIAALDIFRAVGISVAVLALFVFVALQIWTQRKPEREARLPDGWAEKFMRDLRTNRGGGHWRSP